MESEKIIDTSLLDWLRTMITREQMADIIDEGVTYEGGFQYNPSEEEHFRTVIPYAYESGSWPINLNGEDVERITSNLWAYKDVPSREMILSEMYICMICIEALNRSWWFEGALPRILGFLIHAVVRYGESHVACRAVLFLHSFARREPELADICNAVSAVLFIDAAAKMFASLDAHDPTDKLHSLPVDELISLWRDHIRCSADSISYIIGSESFFPRK